MTHPYFKDRDAFIDSILAGLQPRAAPDANAVADDYLASANLGSMGAPLAALAQQGAMPAGTAADVMSQFAPDASGVAVSEPEDAAFKKQALRQAIADQGPLADMADYSKYPRTKRIWDERQRKDNAKAKQQRPDFLYWDPADPEGQRHHETDEEYNRRAHPDPRIYPPARRT